MFQVISSVFLWCIIKAEFWSYGKETILVFYSCWEYNPKSPACGSGKWDIFFFILKCLLIQLAARISLQISCHEQASQRLGKKTPNYPWSHFSWNYVSWASQFLLYFPVEHHHIIFYVLTWMWILSEKPLRWHSPHPECTYSSFSPPQHMNYLHWNYWEIVHWSLFVCQFSNFTNQQKKVASMSADLEFWK